MSSALTGTSGSSDGIIAAREKKESILVKGDLSERVMELETRKDSIAGEDG